MKPFNFQLPPASDTSYALKNTLSGDQSRTGQSDLLFHQELFFRDLEYYPEKTVYIGLDHECMPVLLDLTKSSSGSILYISGIYSKFDRLVINLCRSCNWKNNRSQVVYGIISPEADDYHELLGYPNCQFLLNPYERLSAEVIFELSAIAEQRKFGRERGPAMLLIIDDLWSYFSHNSDYGTFVNLKWLINYGPASQIWPLMSIRKDDLNKFKPPFINLFRTIITNAQQNADKLIPPWQSQNMKYLDKGSRDQYDHYLKVGDSVIPINFL